MVRQIRGGNFHNGLLLANGGVLSYQHVLCLSSQPRRESTVYPTANPLPGHIEDPHVPAFITQAEGEAIVEVISIILFELAEPLLTIARLIQLNSTAKEYRRMVSLLLDWLPTKTNDSLQLLAAQRLWSSLPAGEKIQ